jgi:Flp pilus assembly protein TadG
MGGPVSRLAMRRTSGGALRRALRRLPGRREEGQALVEFALVLIPLVLILFGALEFGRAWNTKNTAVHLANQVARMAAVNNVICTGAGGLRTEANTDGLPAATTITWTTGTASPQQPVTATVTVPFSSFVFGSGNPIFNVVFPANLQGTATMRDEVAVTSGSC